MNEWEIFPLISVFKLRITFCFLSVFQKIMTYLFDFPHGPKVGAKKYVILLLDSIHYLFLNNSGIEFSFGPGNWKYMAALYIFVKFRLKKYCQLP